ncbi:MAG: glucokinase [Pseudomonadales bacterium]|nr:glucokinase [Pseudomonadales bacterium]
MSDLPPQPIRVVADVGGTNTRLALFDPSRNEIRALSTYINREFALLEDIFTHWLDNLGEQPPTACCIAVAAPPSDDQVTMSNMDWSFSCSELATRFGFRQLRRLNDFEANAYALPHLASGDSLELYPGHPVAGGRLATLGPGTGLGGAFLTSLDGSLQSFACEPGHMGLAPGTELELEIFRALLPRYGNIYAELLVSGPGLARLYVTLGEIRGERTVSLAPQEVSRLALAGEDKLCSLALDTFCALLGSASGDFLLATGSYGGLYLGGGIVPGLTSFMKTSAFHQRLVEKGAMREVLAGVPVHVITTGQPGLIGAAHAPLK